MQPGDRGDAQGAAAGEAREMKQSLQRTRKMMAEQLSRVAQVSEVMGEQDALLQNTFAEHQASRRLTKGEGWWADLGRLGDMNTVFVFCFVFSRDLCWRIYQSRVYSCLASAYTHCPGKMCSGTLESRGQAMEYAPEEGLVRRRMHCMTGLDVRPRTVGGRVALYAARTVTNH